MKAARRRLITAAAVLFALGIGIALGAGPLSRPADVLPGLPGHSTSGDPSTAAFESGYIAKTGGTVLEGRLDGHGVAIVSIDGADSAQAKAVAASVRKAGAHIASQTNWTAKLIDPANRQFVEGVARQAGSKVEGVAKSDSSYGRIGAVLARILLGAHDSDAATIWSAFAEGGLVSGSQPRASADAIVVLTGNSRSVSESKVIAELTRALDHADKGTVLAGPAAASLSGGPIAELRDSNASVSTVDVTNSAAGSVVVAMALQRDVQGKPGAWGTPRSADGPLP